MSSGEIKKNDENLLKLLEEFKNIKASGIGKEAEENRQNQIKKKEEIFKEIAKSETKLVHTFENIKNVMLILQQKAYDGFKQKKESLFTKNWKEDNLDPSINTGSKTISKPEAFYKNIAILMLKYRETNPIKGKSTEEDIQKKYKLILDYNENIKPEEEVKITEEKKNIPIGDSTRTKTMDEKKIQLRKLTESETFHEAGLTLKLSQSFGIEEQKAKMNQYIRITKDPLILYESFQNALSDIDDEVEEFMMKSLIRLLYNYANDEQIKLDDIIIEEQNYNLKINEKELPINDALRANIIIKNYNFTEDKAKHYALKESNMLKEAKLNKLKLDYPYFDLPK